LKTEAPLERGSLTKETPMSREFDRRIPAALPILRFFLAIFLVQWSIEKLILPNATASIAQNFYGVALAAPASYALGVAELVPSLALLFGLYRTFSYGLSLLIHTVTVIVSWRELLDPWGLAKVGSHLWLSTWPTWGGFIALFLMRAWDTWTIDGWRQSRGAQPMDQAIPL
jgi:putative oxidoreductase